MKHSDNIAGFTLIELLLSVVTISLIAGISMPVYVSYQNRNELESKVFELTGMIRRAQMYARSGSGDSQWGVNVQSGVSATLFKGTSYATRDTAEDEILVLPSSISTSGLSNILFTKLEGDPTTSGSVTLLSASINQSKTVTITSGGMVSY